MRFSALAEKCLKWTYKSGLINGRSSLMAFFVHISAGWLMARNPEKYRGRLANRYGYPLRLVALSHLLIWVLALLALLKVDFRRMYWILRHTLSDLERKAEGRK